MKYLFFLLFSIFAFNANAQIDYKVVTTTDSVFVETQGNRIPVTSADLEQQQAQKAKQLQSVSEELKLLERIKALREQQQVIREEEIFLSKLLGEVRQAESKIKNQ